MTYALDNFVRSTLQADITAADTTITVAKAAAPLRDPPDASEASPGILVLQDKPASPTKIEIITYTGRSIAGNVVTLTGCTRGQEDSTASVWSSGAPTLAGLTAGVIKDLQDSLDDKLDSDGNAVSATTATKLATARTISLGGLLGGSASFDGSGNVTITATMADATLSIAKVSGLQSSLDAKIASADKGVANGVAPLDGTGHVSTDYLPQSVLGALNWQDTWDASTGDPPTTTPKKGWYYTVNKAGTTSLDGITDWNVGDWAIYNGSVWAKADNTDHIISVAGLSGTITSAALQAALGLGSAAYQEALNFTPVQQGTGPGQGANAVKIGWSSDGLTFYVDSTKLPFRVNTTTTYIDGALNVGGKSITQTVNNEVRWGNTFDDWYYFSNSNDHAGFYSDANGYAFRVVKSTRAMDVYGSFSAPSVTDTSDARLKTNVRRDLNRYRGIRRAIEMVLYDRIDGPDDEPGVLAQEVQRAGCHADDFVGKNADGKLTVHYGKLALACALDPEGL